jgi:hypothetical protein
VEHPIDVSSLCSVFFSFLSLDDRVGLLVCNKVNVTSLYLGSKSRMRISDDLKRKFVLANCKQCQ